VEVEHFIIYMIHNIVYIKVLGKVNVLQAPS